MQRPSVDITLVRVVKGTNYSRLRNTTVRARDFLHNVISRSHIAGALRNNIRPMDVGTLKRPI